MGAGAARAVGGATVSTLLLVLLIGAPPRPAIAAESGLLSVSKAVVWDGVPPVPVEPVSVDISCRESEGGPVLPGFPRTEQLFDGGSVDVPAPAEAYCDVVETETQNATVVTMAVDGGQAQETESVAVVVAAQSDGGTRVGITNIYRTGGVKVVATISGPAARWAQGPFEFRVDCTHDVLPALTFELTLDATRTSAVASPVPAFSTCTVTQTSAGDATLATPTVVDSVVIPPYAVQPPGPVVVTADQPYPAGQVSIATTVSGPGAALVPDAPFQVTATCVRDLVGGGTQTVLDRSVTVPAGTQVDLPDPLPMGARCWGTETDTVGATTTIVDPDGPARAVTVSPQASQVRITAANTFQETTLTVAKTLAGGPPSGRPFEFAVVCTLPTSPAGQHRVTLPAADAAFPLPADSSRTIAVPLGSTCTTRETDAGGAVSVAVSDTSGSAVDGVTSMSQPHHVTVTNTFPPLNLAISKSVRAVSGATATWSIAVANHGAQPTVEPIVVFDPLPAGLSFASASGVGWSCTAVQRDVTCTHAAALPVGVTTGVDLVTTIVGSTAKGVVNVAYLGPTIDGPSSAAAIPASKIVQAPTRPLRLPRDVAASGWTTLLRLPVRTNAGQTATVRARCAPLLRTEPAGDVARCRIIRAGHVLRVWLPGDTSTLVRVVITAPATAGYTHYRETRSWSVRRA